MDYDNIGNRIWIAWDYNYTDVDIIEVGNQFIHCRATIRALQEYVDITIVYGATEVSDRRELWASLESLVVQCINTPWLVGGDFNVVRDLSEVCGMSGDIRVAMEEFNMCLQNTALLPLPMQGEWYTWHNRSASPRNLCKRLDRMLTNDTWTLRFPSVFYQCLTPRTSDHSPMVVNGDNQQRFGGMFRFDNFLTLSPDFIPSVQSIWQQQIVGVPMFLVTRKLKALKPIFREQRRNKGDLSHNVELARGFLEQAQVLVSSHRQDELILLLEHCSRLVYAKAAELERIVLQQRAKMEWMKGGDQCSRVFFRKIAQRRTARRILQINDAQGITITEPNAFIHEFISYYQSLLGGDRRQRVMDLRFLRPWARHIITTEEAGHLLEPFSAEDIKKAVFDIGEDRAPGPDGYSSGFYKNAWPVVGQEIMKAVLEFFSTGKLLKQINSTILTVIPKVHSPTSVADFRPISCCNVLYKIIAKLIVQKLSVILDKIISPCQAAFVPGRSIGDNVMLAQELFTGYNQARLPPRCALKVDIRKAYDTVEWDFLLSLLQLFGFPEIFRRWVEECISSPSFSVGMNGKPHGYFAGARGLRQGDPLSPYLFVLVMEVLHMGILQLIEQDMNFAFHWKCDDLRIFQLGFADDLLLFCRANTESVRVFKSGLDRFADWSGLRLNVEKSHIIISRSAQNVREELLAILGFQEGHLPMRYLGLPLISSRLSIADCQPLLSKIDTRINGWEELALSYAGRGSLKTLRNDCELSYGEVREIVDTLKLHGRRSANQRREALAFKDMGTLNRALMCKKLCEVIRCDRTSIWVEWLRHGRLRDDSIWTIPENRGPWGWRKMLRLRGWLHSMVEYRIGDGSDFFLWKDRCHHLGPLLDRFPRGPNSLGLNESTMLSSVIYEGHWHWPLITDMECVEITHVLPRIQGGTDCILWKGSSGKPTTQEFYRAMIPAAPKVDLVEDASVVFGALYDSSGLIGTGSEMLNGVQENGVGSTSSIYPTDAC
ncbi:UNVERIFIED_CONTAM: putative ribonuclease H protein [Sesamum indicum]